MPYFNRSQLSWRQIGLVASLFYIALSTGIDGRAVGMSQRSALHPTTPLPAGSELSRPIGRNEDHHYNLVLRAGEVLRVEMKKEHGIDLTATLHGHGGQRLLEAGGADGHVPYVELTPDSARGLVRVVWLARAAGIYRLDVNARNVLPSGHYIIRRFPSRQNEEPAQVAAEILAIEGRRLYTHGDDEPKLDAARAKLEIALDYWRARRDGASGRNAR